MSQLVIASPEFSSKIGSILVENGVTDPIEKVNCSQASELAGLHFASLPHFVEVTFKGDKKTLYLFIKKSIAFPTPELTKVGEYMTQKEGIFLKNVVTDINNFMYKATGRHDFLRPHFPKTYYFDENGALMENLYKGGYGMYEKGKKQGYAAAMAVIRALAKLHGASWAWACDLGGEDKVKEKYPILFEEFMDSKAGFEVMETMVGNTIKTMAVLVENLKDETIDKKNAIQKYGKHSKPGTSVMGDNLIKIKSPSNFRAISHSDCWTNNMMFKPDHTSVKLLDFQVLRYNCPMIDLAEYFSTSVMPNVLKEWKTLFNAYYQTLKETVEMTGQEFPITLNQVLADFASKHEIGLAKGLHLILGREAHEAYNVHESKEGLNPDVYEAFVHNWIKNNPEKANHVTKECVQLINDFVAIQPYTD